MPRDTIQRLRYDSAAFVLAIDIGTSVRAGNPVRPDGPHRIPVFQKTYDMETTPDGGVYIDGGPPGD